MQQERRRFFRIEDSLGVAYRLLTAEELALGESVPLAIDSFSLIVNFDKEIEHSLGKLRVREPLVAELLDTFNKKMNCVINQLQMDTRQQQLQHTTQSISISACGVGLHSEQAFAADDQLLMDFILYPSNLHVSSRARVVACEAGDSDDRHEGYFIRAEFIGMSETDQELLIQHIVKRQTSLRRDQRAEPVASR